MPSLSLPLLHECLRKEWDREESWHHLLPRDNRNALLLLFTHSVASDSLGSHGWQHTRLPCPSLSPGLCSNSCPLSWWCHPTISSSVVPFSSCPQSFRVFSNESVLCITWPKFWSFSSVLPMNIQSWFPLGLTGLISCLSKGFCF